MRKMKKEGFRVRVVRYAEDKFGYSCAGIFESEVYAIDRERDEFLVYDPGEDLGDIGGIMEGFKWVNFRETMQKLGGIEGEERESVVKLVD